MARFELNRRERPGERRESHSRSHSTWCFLSLFLSFLAVSPLHFGIPRSLFPLFCHSHRSRSPVHLPAPFGSHQLPHADVLLSHPSVTLYLVVHLSCTFLTSSWTSRSSRSPYSTSTLLRFFVWILPSHTLLYPFFSLSLFLSPFLFSSNTPSHVRSFFFLASLPFSLIISHSIFVSPLLVLALAASLEPVLFDSPSLSRYAASQWRI